MSSHSNTRQLRAKDISADFFTRMSDNGFDATPAQVKKITEKIASVLNYHPKVGIFGQTGAGKSSLCNALFGRKIAKVSDIAACTRKPQEILLKLSSDGGGLTLLDVPGVGESGKRDEEYRALYDKLIPNLDIVLWVLKADERAYGIDEIIYNEVVSPIIKEYGIPILFVLNQVEKIAPSKDWDFEYNQPGEKQIKTINAKKLALKTRFKIPLAHICPVSAEEKYGLISLIDKIVRYLPAEKKYSIARTARLENVSQYAIKESEKGLWDTIKDYSKEIIQQAIPYLAKAAFDYISKRWPFSS